MNRLPQVLICDDDSTFHLAVKYSLKGKYECRSAYNGDEALAIVKAQRIDILLLDIQMRTTDEGLKYLPRLKDADSELAIVMSSAMTDFQTVREAMRLGAVDYVPKDFEPNDLAHTLERVLERRSLMKRREQQDFETRNGQKQHLMLGTGPAIVSLRRTLEKLRQSPVNVVITGETGTGKEVVARQLRGRLADGAMAPFVAVDSSTIQGSTAESLLFGHEKGAFTGAERTTKGVFEEADGGIVYFDEIGNMPLDIQAKLLRVLQEREVTRLGSSKVIELEFRVICATNRDLEQMVRAGQFKDDLLQRLNVVPVHLPPLRERKEDIPELTAHFARKARGLDHELLRFSEEALAVFQAYDWPGNIRELANVVSYVVALADSPEIEVSDLPPKLRDRAKPSGSLAKETPGAGFYERVAGFEKDLLAAEYAKASGNISRLALGLGMDRSHLYTKLREHGIHPARRTAE